uniref:Uncharacterized protein n=1 Tax=Arundo donax TaxID=35708 RepID=A0A0A9G735_ARUDO
MTFVICLYLSEKAIFFYIVCSISVCCGKLQIPFVFAFPC